MSIAQHPAGYEVPGSYLEPPAGAPVAAFEGYCDGGYVTGPGAPLLADYASGHPLAPALQDALMIMAGTVRWRRRPPAAPRPLTSRRRRCRC
jgi:hypothetical protein